VALALPPILLLCWLAGDSFWMASGISEWERLVPLSRRLVVMLACGFALGLALSSRARRRGEPEPHPLGPVALLVWIVFPLLGLGWIRLHYGIAGLVALILLSKIGDVAGYYLGSAIGKRHPFPKLSPGKTVAGCVASFVVAAASGLACQSMGLLPEARFGAASGLGLGALVNLASQSGDLLESSLKRHGGVKDSGTLFGPSGGVLDVVDSLLLSVPAGMVGLTSLYSL
jgi:CDP-diglyceride synthetase